MIENNDIPTHPDEDRRRAFEHAWVIGGMPRIEAFLPDEHDPHYVPTLQELIVIHLEFMWKQWRKNGGKEPLPDPVEFYVSQFGLQGRRNIIGRLIAGEVAARISAEQRPDVDEYLQRFTFLREHPQILELAFPENTLYAGTSKYDLKATKSDSHSDSWHTGMEPISGFRLVRVLGEGGFGQVWEARGPGDVPTALKRVSLLGPLGEREREALDVLKGVRHPHLLSIYAYWIVGDFLVIGCELADESLLSVLKRVHAHGGAGMSQEDTVHYLLDAAEALDYLGRPIHKVNNQTVGIQHRDIKPANLLVQGGAIKVGDFGLAKALQGLADSGSLSMTVAYAPPEAFSGQVTPYSDQYSLGVTFCELRTGRRPFSGTPAEVMHAHLHGEPNLDSLNPAERAIVARALAKDPEKRWASCVKFLGEIDRAGNRMRPSLETAQPQSLVKNGDPVNSNVAQPPLVSGRLLIDDNLVPLPLRSTAVSAFLTGALAEVTVVQRFVNQYQRIISADYIFPLPADAAVHGFRIILGDRVIDGVVEERTAAAETFEEAKSAGHGAALVQELSCGVFSVSVANILPGQDVRIELTYLQVLKFQNGKYHFTFPLHVTASDLCPADSHDLREAQATAVLPPQLPPGFLRGDVFQINLELNSGVPLCGFDSPSHDIQIIEEIGASRVRIALRQESEIPNRDFVLTYNVLGPHPEHVLLCQPDKEGDVGTLLLITTPPRPEFGTGSVPQMIWSGGDVAGIVPGGRTDDSVTDDFFREPLLIFGRYDGKVPSVRLRGRVADQSYETTVMPEMFLMAEHRINLAVLWASYSIDHLLHQWGASPDKDIELRGRVTQLSLHYRLVSPWTSFVAVEFRRKAEREQVRNVVPVVIPQLAAAAKVIPPSALADTEFSPTPDSSVLELPDSEQSSVLEELLTQMPVRVPTDAADESRDKLRDLVATYGGPSEESRPVADASPPQQEEAASTDPPQSQWKSAASESQPAPRARRNWLKRLMDGLYGRHASSSVGSEGETASGTPSEAVPNVLPSPNPTIPLGDDDQRISSESILSKLRRPHVSQSGPEPQVASSSPAESTPRRDSIRLKLGPVRKARCQFTFESHEGGATVHRELPFVAGVLGNFSGHQEIEPADLRAFFTIDRDNFTEIMRELNVCLQINSPDNDSPPAAESQLKLRFENLRDFDPAIVAEQIRRLREISEMAVSENLTEVLKNPDFRKLETLWRELNSLVERTETSPMLQIRILPCADTELQGELMDSRSGLPSVLEHLLYRESKSNPLSVLLIAHEFSPQAKELQLLARFASLTAMFFCPVFAAASLTLTGLKRRTAGSGVRPTADSAPLARPALPLQRDESRIVVLIHPMENADASKPNLPVSSLFDLGVRITESYQVFGRVLNLQQRMTHDSASELSFPEYGMFALLAAEETAAAGAGRADEQTSQQRSTGWYRDCEVVQIESMLTAYRFAQYVQKMIQQEPLLSLDNRDLQESLTRWLSKYVFPADTLDSDSAIRYPLTIAEVEVTQDSALNRDRIVLHLQLRSSMSATAELCDEQLILWRPCVAE
ncbi:MAG: type VI secretion system contractile sheath large subunit [Planctomycetaceae bacterium]|nr:type VI secretion system contractile sheath large subunit [Planctomycetaceae bacterium]